MNDEKIVHGLTIIVMGIIVAVAMGTFAGVAWRFVLQPLFYGGC